MESNFQTATQALKSEQKSGIIGRVVDKLENSAAARKLGVGTLALASFFGGASEAEAQQPAGNSAAVWQIPRASQGVEEVSSASEVAERWAQDKTQQLFVRDLRELQNKGALTSSQAEELAEFLADHPRWVVFISSAAQGERFGPHSDNDAVEYALNELRKQDGWDSENMNIMYLCMDGRLGVSNPFRKVRILTGDNYDSAGLGDKQWPGNLENLAIRFLKDGWRVEAAVENTLSELDSRYDRLIAQQKRERENAVESSDLAIQAAASALVALKTETDSFNEQFPGRRGALANPDLDGRERVLEQARQYHEEQNFNAARSVAIDLSEELGEQRQLLAEYGSAGEKIELLSSELESGKQNEFAFRATSEISAVEDSLIVACEAWEAGDTDYGVKLEQLQSESRSLSSALANARKGYESDGETLQDLAATIGILGNSEQAAPFEQRLDELGNKHQRVAELWSTKSPAYSEQLSVLSSEVSGLETEIKGAENEASSAAAAKRSLLFGGGAAGLLGLGVAGLLFSRTRRREKTARERLERLKLASTKREDGLERIDMLASQALRDESGKVVEFAKGSVSLKDADAAREALSLAWAQQVLAVQEVFGQVESLLSPQTTAEKFRNLFSSKNYELALEIMAGDAEIEFSDKNREKIRAAFGERIGLLQATQASLDELGSFKRSLDDIDEEYAKLCGTAIEKLSAIKDARKDVSGAIETLESNTATLAVDAKALEALAEADKENPALFKLGRVRGQFIPTLESRISDAKERMSGDPLGVIRQIEEDSEVLERASSHVETLRKRRYTEVEKLAQGQACFAGGEELAIDSAWMSAELEEVDTHIDIAIERLANHLSEANSENSSGLAPVYPLSERLNDWRTKIDQAIALNLQRTGPAKNEIAALRNEVDSERAAYAAQLEIDEETPLTEDNPDEDIAQAETQFKEFAEALALGDLGAAERNSNAIKAHAHAVRAIIAETRSAFEAYDANRANRLEWLTKSNLGFVDAETRLEELVELYAPSALIIRDQDQFFGKASGTIVDNKQEARAFWNAAQASVGQAEDDYASARFLAAAGELAAASVELKSCDARFEEVVFKQQQLEALTQENASAFGELNQREQNLRTSLRAKQVNKDTRTLFSRKSSRLFEAAHAEQARTPLDPIVVSERIERTNQSFARIERMVERDHKAYEAAVTALQQTQAAILKADRRAESLDRNDIPDTLVADRAEDQLDRLELEIEELARRFSNAKHVDWEEYETRFNSFRAAIASNLKTIEEEDETGKQTRRVLEEALRTAKEAERWHGSFGIGVDRSVGVSEKQRMQAAFQSADFGEALRWAREVEDDARDAVNEAKQRVQAEQERRDAIERSRRAEEARQRAAAEAARQAVASAARAAASAARAAASSSSNSSGFSGGGSF